MIMISQTAQRDYSIKMSRKRKKFKSAHLKYKALIGSYNLNIIETNMETHKLKTAHLSFKKTHVEIKLVCYVFSKYPCLQYIISHPDF